MGILRVVPSDTPLREEYERMNRRLLERGQEAPERTPEDRLVGEWSEDVRELCARNWRIRMRQEYRAAAVFSGMVPQFMEAGAPVDVIACLLRASLDELRHAALCAEVVQVLGHDPALETSLIPDPPAEHEGICAEEVALRNLFFVSCLSETVAVSLLTEERSLCEEPYIARVLRQLTADETLHARMGWIWLRASWPGLSGEARARMDEYLQLALAYYEERMLRATPVERVPDDVLVAARKIGFADTGASRELFYATMETVILPQLDEIGLDASSAWRARRCSDDRTIGNLTLSGTNA